MWQAPNLSLVFDSLGWAILHSIWQGALAALLVWVFRSMTREGAADVRYIFGYLTLTGLFAAFIATFIYYFSAGTVVGETSISLLGLSGAEASGAAATGSLGPLALLFNSTNLIGSVWAVCFGLLGAKYLAAFRLTHKLRKTGLTELPGTWQSRFTTIARQSGVSKKTRAFISEHVSSPITFGFFKPVVMVPAWFFTGMNAEQCEAVLLHELAHIRRHDYLANILQILIKTVFFYHPAIQFISRTVDLDREHACDDFAVAMTKNPEGLARALGTIRINAARSGGVFALSADGPDAPLMGRLKRLMGTPVKRSQTGAVRGFASASMLALSCALFLALGATSSEAHPPTEAEARAMIEKIDKQNLNLAGAAAPRWDSKRHNKAYNYGTYTKDGKTYMVKTNVQGESFIKVDGSWHNIKSRPDLKIIPPKAPESPLALYPEVDAAPWAVPAPAPIPAPATPFAPVPAPAPSIEASNRFSWASPEEQAVLAEEARQIAEEQAELSRELAEEQAELAREMAEEQAELAREQAELQRELQREKAELQRELQREQAELQRELEREQAEIQREKKREYAEMMRAEKQRHRDEHQAEKYNRMRDRLIPRLKADGYMKSDSSKVTMKLTEQDIFINGKKLSNSEEGAYCDIVSDYLTRKGDVKKIVIKPGYLHVESKGKTGRSAYTHTE